MEQVEKPIKWALQDLLPEPVEQTLEEVFSKLEEALVEFEATRDILNNEISPQDFNKVLEKLETITLLKSRVEAYADLAFAEDTQNPSALNLRDRVDQVLTDSSNRALFFEMWFKELPEDATQNLISHSGDLHYFLETMTRFKPFTLTEPEERMINLKDVNGIDAMVNLYEMITNQFTFKMEVDGQTQTLTRDQLSSCFSLSSPEVRRQAYQELYRVYTEHSTVLAQMYIHRVRDWHTEGIEMRGFASPISARNVENDLPDEVVETLLDVCRKNAALFQGYFRLKAKWLGLDKFRRYDIYAPLTPSEKKFEYGVAKQMVMDSFHAFSPSVAELAQCVFNENHLDSEIRAGQTRRCVLLHSQPGINTMGDDQLRWQSARHCHTGARIGARDSLHVVESPFCTHTTTCIAIGRNRFRVCRDATHRSTAQAGK